MLQSSICAIAASGHIFDPSEQSVGGIKPKPPR
jgi:hypothetical protein